LLAALSVAGCVSTDPYTGGQKVSNTAKGAGWGALAGAVVGAATSGSDNRAEAAVIGAAAGGAVGGGVGFYMDKQEAQLRQQLEGTGVRVQREGDQIRLIMPGNITFDSSRDAIKAHFLPVLDSVALVVDEFDQTAVRVSGHTDSTGSQSINQSLSESRAHNVASYLIDRGVQPGRVRAQGFGPRLPVASNDYPSGREQNRRVEIDLLPL
jgi:outer membrane protein OmpA-like peptidoglycan-associated protein